MATKTNLNAPVPSLTKAAAAMAALLSALPMKDRQKARIELVGQVEDRQRQDSTSRSLYPRDSVVRKEIERIADQLASVFRSALPRQQSTLWGDFSVGVNTRLAVIEFTAKRAIEERVSAVMEKKTDIRELSGFLDPFTHSR